MVTFTRSRLLYAAKQRSENLRKEHPQIWTNFAAAREKLTKDAEKTDEEVDREAADEDEDE